jgi:hypothetical protein
MAAEPVASMAALVALNMSIVLAGQRLPAPVVVPARAR